MKIEIKRWDKNDVIVCGKYVSIKDCLEKNKNKSFYRANLRSADLRYADLHYADLSSADLSSAYLSHANLYSADLRSADYLEYAYIYPSTNFKLAILTEEQKTIIKNKGGRL